MKLKNLIKLQGDSASLIGVCLEKNKATVMSGYALVEKIHDLDIPLKDGECVIVTSEQAKQIDAIKGVHSRRDGDCLILNGVSIRIEKRSESAFIRPERIESIIPRAATRTVTFAINASLLNDLQRAMADGMRSPGLKITIDLDGGWNKAIKVETASGKGLIMPMRLANIGLSPEAAQALEKPATGL